MSNKQLTKFIESKGVKYYPVIGLEIHAELNTKTKMWCGCVNDPFEDMPNKNICPICMAHPGTLPVPNLEAIKKVMQMGAAINATIANFTEFDRKNYFYPDIPKGYQISQYKYPIVSGGNIDGVDITRVHLEEDTATSTHDKDDATLVNFNRAGVPLMELVTEPVIHDSATAVSFAKEMQLLLKYLNISDADIEKGHMRMEANVSLTKDPHVFNKKYVEVKNIGSFKSLEKAIEYEFKRQIGMYENEEEFVKETRGFDEASGTTKSQRVKENSEDYRYFPDPDITKFFLHDNPIFGFANLQQTLPELPKARRARYISQGVKADTAELFVTQPVFGNYFDKVTSSKNSSAFITLASNYISSDLAGLLKDKSEEEKIINFPKVEYFRELVQMIVDEKLASRGAKDLLVILVSEANKPESMSPEQIANEKDMLQISDELTLSPFVISILADEKNAKSITDYKSGKEAALMSLVGQVIKQTGGKANPGLTKQIFVSRINTNA